MATAEQMPTGPQARRAETSPLVERIRRGVIGEGELMDGPFGPRRVTYADDMASGRSLDFIRDAVLPRYANTHTESSGTGADPCHRQRLRTVAGWPGRGAPGRGPVRGPGRRVVPAPPVPSVPSVPFTRAISAASACAVRARASRNA
jgi:hypothetical protein